MWRLHDPFRLPFGFLSAVLRASSGRDRDASVFIHEHEMNMNELKQRLESMLPYAGLVILLIVLAAARRSDGATKTETHSKSPDCTHACCTQRG
jgi:hypothetical protein